MEEFMTKEELQERITECSFYISLYISRGELQKAHIQRVRLNRLVNMALDYKDKKDA